jgi:uncharacterized membrane protein
VASHPAAVASVVEDRAAVGDMKTDEFINKLDEAKIVSAIAAAEKKTSGEIRVYISSKAREDAMAAATARFEKLGMTKTRNRNGVLIYFAPVTQKFAVIGDEGIHSRCGKPFWESITSQMSASLKKDQFTDAVIFAVETVGAELAKHFPVEPGDENELSNDIVRD